MCLCGEFSVFWRICPISPPLACFGTGRRVHLKRSVCVFAAECRRRFSIRARWKLSEALSLWINLHVSTLTMHLPPRRVQLVRRYGIYAGCMRSVWPERAGIVRYAPGTARFKRAKDTSRRPNQSAQKDDANGVRCETLSSAGSGAKPQQYYACATILDMSTKVFRVPKGRPD